LATAVTLAAALACREGRAAPALSVQAVTPAGLKAAVARQKGKVVVVNLWATWCVPCIKEMPDLIKLSRTYGSQGVAVLAVSTDEPDRKPDVLSLMKKKQIELPVLMRTSGSDADFIKVLDPKWSGTVPVTYVFDRKGKLSGAPLSGPQGFAKFEKAVKAALK
jgi:thiol-disulfide isomerase/thioredoxin